MPEQEPSFSVQGDCDEQLLTRLSRMKYLGVILAVVLSSQLFFAEAHSLRPRNIAECAAKTLELTTALSNCQVPPDVPDLDFASLITAVDTATQFLDLSEQIFEAVCEPACGQPIVDFLYSCDFEDLGIAAVELCSELRNNTPCYSLVTPDVGDLYILGPSDFGTTANTVCQADGCSDDCRNALTNLRAEVGCCIHLADTDLFSNLRNVAENSFWAACDMTVPGVCPRSLNGAATTAATIITVITATVLALLV